MENFSCKISFSVARDPWASISKFPGGGAREGGGCGLLRISSDGGDRRIFLSWKFAFPGFFGGGLQTYFSSFSCGNFVMDKSCLLLIPVTWYPEYCPASGLACLFHGALEHMGGWRGEGGIAELFFYFLWKFCRGQILSLPHPVTWYAENYPASGSACLFHSALEHIGPIFFLFSVETL